MPERVSALRPLVAREAIDALHHWLLRLGITGAYKLGDDTTLSVCPGLVVRYQDGMFRWREGAIAARHLGDDPTGCALRLARRSVELRSTEETVKDANSVTPLKAV